MKNDKKHIDRLFQEGLKNLEATPSNSVWENVSGQLLNNQKQRRIIPMWIKLSAIAAGLLFLFTLGNKVFFQDNNSTLEVNETIVDTKFKNEQSIKNSDSARDPNIIDSDDAVNLAQEGSDENETKESLSGIQKNSVINKNESVVVNNDESTTSSKNNTLNLTTKKELAEEKANSTVAYNLNSEKNNVIESQKKIIQGEVSKTSDIKSTIAKAESTNELDDKKVNQIRELSTEETVAENYIKEREINEAGKISIEDAITENSKAANEEDKLTEGEASKRWGVVPNIAPVYFNSLGTGSSMDGEFVNNTKSGKVNMSYGVSASYAINEKINVRVGVNSVRLGYNTLDVFNASDMEMSPIKPIAVRNIEIDKTPIELAYVTVAGMSFAQVPELLSNEYNASIDQELAFLEIPLEIQYKIINTKLGISAIGGFSALFLNSNEIYSTLNGNSTLIGKATNINNLSYSANLGFGFNYKLSNKLNLNLEPMFKYQLNTFRNTSGNFKPYFIGVYSGLSFRF